jgi:hypothetical protein
MEAFIVCPKVFGAAIEKNNITISDFIVRSSVCNYSDNRPDAS